MKERIPQLIVGFLILIDSVLLLFFLWDLLSSSWIRFRDWIYEGKNRKTAILVLGFISLLLLFLVVFLFKKIFGNSNGSTIPDTLTVLLISVPVAWGLWVWRNDDKQQDIANDVKNLDILDRDSSTNHFLKFCEIVCDSQKLPGARAAALYGLNSFLSGKKGNELKFMAWSFLRDFSRQIIYSLDIFDETSETLAKKRWLSDEKIDSIEKLEKMLEHNIKNYKECQEEIEEFEFKKDRNDLEFNKGKLTWDELIYICKKNESFLCKQKITIEENIVKNHTGWEHIPEEEKLLYLIITHEKRILQNELFSAYKKTIEMSFDNDWHDDNSTIDNFYFILVDISRLGKTDKYTQCKFIKTTLHDIKSKGKNFQNCDFYMSTFKNINLSSYVFGNSFFVKSNWLDSSFSDLTLNNVTFTRSNFEKINVEKASFETVKFLSSEFLDLSVNEIESKNSLFYQSQFPYTIKPSVAININLMNTQLIETRFSSISFCQITFTRLNIDSCQFQNASLSIYSFKRCKFINNTLFTNSLFSTGGFDDCCLDLCSLREIIGEVSKENHIFINTTFKNSFGLCFNAISEDIQISINESTKIVFSWNSQESVKQNESLKDKVERFAQISLGTDYEICNSRKL